MGNILEELQVPLIRLLPRNYKTEAGVFGVEIEVEGTDLPVQVPGWKVTKDGSLRGEAYEYVTDGAKTAYALGKCMDQLEKQLVQWKSKVNEDSFRCSTHVHVNMQHYPVHTFIGSLVVFATVEHLFMRLCGPTRDGNLFCLPSYDCGDMNTYVRNLFDYWQEDGGIMRFHERGKYAALNTNPMNTFGTIEFRTFPCSVQKPTVMSWAARCERIVHVASASPHSAFIGEVDEAYQSPVAYALRVFDVALLKELGEFEVTRLIRMGCEDAYEISRTYDRFQKHLAKKAA